MTITIWMSIITTVLVWCWIASKASKSDVNNILYRLLKISHGVKTVYQYLEQKYEYKGKIFDNMLDVLAYIETEVT